MGADWYCIQCFYGYQISIITDDSSFKHTINLINKLSNIIDSSFKFVAVLEEFHSRMEGMSYNERIELYNGSPLIIGFNTVNDLCKMNEYADKLKEYITDNPIFMGIEFADKPAFFYGLNVIDDLYDMYYEDDISELDEGDEDYETDSDDLNEEDDDNTSDEEEEKIVPHTEISKSKIE